MKKNVRLLSVVMTILLAFCLCSCTDDSTRAVVSVSVNGEALTDEYIGYFFYVAKTSMISEAGYTEENSTDEDIATYWETTEIEGVGAIEVARDIAADNAVFQKVQYQKALSEGVTLSQDQLSLIDDQITEAQNNNGGEAAFSELLDHMGTNMDAYRQIVTENAYISELFALYDSKGLLDISDEEFQKLYDSMSLVTSDAGLILDYAKKEKFNNMAKDWVSAVDIVIDDEAMKKFNI